MKLNLNNIEKCIFSFVFSIFLFFKPINELVGMYEYGMYISLFFRFILNIGILGLILLIIVTLRKFDIYDLLIIFIIILLLTFDYFVYPNNIKYYKIFSFFYYFKYSLGLFFVIRHSEFNEKVFNYTLFFLSFFIGLFLILFKKIDINLIPYMEFGFSMIVPVLGMLYTFFIVNSKVLKGVSFFFFISYSSYLFLYSNRGVLVGVVFAFTLLVVKKIFIKKRTLKNISLSMLFLLLINIIVLNLNNILLSLILFLNNRNIESRTLNLIMQGKFKNDSGRQFIYDFFVERLKEKPLGYGIYGDRWLYDVYNGIPMYPHNLFLEILIQYGILLGIIMIIYFVYLTISRFILNKNLSFNEYALFTIILSQSVILLQVSSSYLAMISFWMYLGLLFRQINKKSNIEKCLKLNKGVK